VENRTERILDTDLLDHVLKSDLVVLDYHLTPDNTVVEPALAILNRLANSDHANLVVIYTAAELKTTFYEVFTRFRGIRDSADFPAEHEDILDGFEVAEPDERVLHAYLTGADDWKEMVGAYRDELTRRTLSRSDQTRIIEIAFAQAVRRLFKKVAAPIDVDLTDLTVSQWDAKVFWVEYKNVFVTFVSKNGTGGIISALEDALVDRAPGLLKLLLAQARNILENGGLNYERSLAGTVERQVGMIYHALGGEEPSEEVRFRELLQRVFGMLRDELVDRVADFGRRALKRHVDVTDAPKAGQQKQRFFLEQARRVAGVTGNSSLKEDSILLALNAFLCSQDFRGSHVRTGTVLRAQGTDDWWLCVAPDCETVPRSEGTDSGSVSGAVVVDDVSGGTWHKALQPCMPMMALRLRRETPGPAPLFKATQGKHIFVNVADAVISLRVLDSDLGQPRPEMFIVANQGRADGDNVVHAYRIVGGKVPRLKDSPLEAIAQLRSEYADRFLQQTGHHTSRVGVDFVDLVPAKIPK
jgi:Response receiver domain